MIDAQVRASDYYVCMMSDPFGHTLPVRVHARRGNPWRVERNLESGWSMIEDRRDRHFYHARDGVPITSEE